MALARVKEQFAVRIGANGGGMASRMELHPGTGIAHSTAKVRKFKIQ